MSKDVETTWVMVNMKNGDGYAIHQRHWFALRAQMEGYGAIGKDVFCEYENMVGSAFFFMISAVSSVSFSTEEKRLANKAWNKATELPDDDEGWRK